jgi:hypothetical protein
LPRSHPGQPCGGVINDRPQAFWLFSTDACGAYGLGDIRIEPNGAGGEIVLVAEGGRLTLRSGTALLLRLP